MSKKEKLALILLAAYALVISVAAFRVAASYIHCDDAGGVLIVNEYKLECK